MDHPVQGWAKEMVLSWEKVSAWMQPAAAGQARLVFSKTVLFFCTTLYKVTESYHCPPVHKRTTYQRHEPSQDTSCEEGAADAMWYHLPLPLLPTPSDGGVLPYQRPSVGVIPRIKGLLCVSATRKRRENEVNSERLNRRAILWS